MKLVMFTTCKPFKGDDAWRQEQAIKSWTLLKGLEKVIIVVGDDLGAKQICKKYDLVHRPDVRTLVNVPYLHSMFEIASSYAGKDDYLMWTNADIIYYQDIIQNILAFDKYRKRQNIGQFLLVGQRYDWHNPCVLKSLGKEHFIRRMNANHALGNEVMKGRSNRFECSLHASCGIDFVIHSKSTFLGKFDSDLAIAGTQHDMILVGTGIANGYFCCDLTRTNFMVHQNHGVPSGYTHASASRGRADAGSSMRLRTLRTLVSNNKKCGGTKRSISDCLTYTKWEGKDITFHDKRRRGMPPRRPVRAVYRNTRLPSSARAVIRPVFAGRRPSHAKPRAAPKVSISGSRRGRRAVPWFTFARGRPRTRAPNRPSPALNAVPQPRPKRAPPPPKRPTRQGNAQVVKRAKREVGEPVLPQRIRTVPSLAFSRRTSRPERPPPAPRVYQQQGPRRNFHTRTIPTFNFSSVQQGNEKSTPRPPASPVQPLQLGSRTVSTFGAAGFSVGLSSNESTLDPASREEKIATKSRGVGNIWTGTKRYR